MNSKTQTQQAGFSIAEIRTSFRGGVITPDDVEYDSARRTFYGGIDRRPAVIIRAQHSDDVARVVRLAHDTGMELAIRSGGHSAVGYCVSEGGIVLDLALMRELQIDVDARTAWVEPGLTAGEYTSAVGAHGLATGFGDTGSVGIGGITLGGGVGYLVRKHGLTIDSLLAAEIVTAGGHMLYIDHENHPDLFWAIRGGGGNFGVVTRFKFQLHPLDSIVGGMLFMPATVETITSFIALAESAPEELSTILNVGMMPPMPFIPEADHGKPIMMIIMVYAGDVAEGERVVAPFRALTAPYADMIRAMQYHEIYEPDQEEYHPIGSSRTMFIDHVDRDVATTILDHLRSSTGTMAVAQLRLLGGAMARVPVDATAFAHRNSKIMVNVAALYEKLDDRPVHETWAAEFAAALQQSDKGAYVNFLGDEGEEELRAAYPARTWNRLVEIKARYDPTNLFRLNQNIPPIQNSK